MDIILLAAAAALCCLAPLIIVALTRGRSDDATLERRERPK
jgi:hypothetical protein